MKHNKLQPILGDITVSGKSEIGIQLPPYVKPDMVLVEFCENGGYASCNPVSDRLTWDIRVTHHHYLLTIRWNVSDARQIKWEIKY
jgi:hypothetical protein